MNQPSAENVERAERLLDCDFDQANAWTDFDAGVRIIAQALQTVEDAAERRGAVKYLREKADSLRLSAKEFSVFTEIAQKAKQHAAMLYFYANELEAATKAPGEV
jgi:hypothetical protein